MISVNVDLSHATESEKETFLTLPHVAGAIDTLATLKRNDVNLSLVVSEQEQTTSEFDQENSSN